MATTGIRYRRAIRSKARQQQIKELSKFKSELLRALEEEGQAVKADYEDVVSDWSDANRPQFTVKRKVTPSRLTVEVRPYARRKASQVFNWVDQGTRPHVIKPKRSNKSGRLTFRTGYQAKTLPVAQAHVGPGASNGPWRKPQVVKHPGTKPRHFSKVFQARSKKRLQRALENKFRALARRMK